MPWVPRNNFGMKMFSAFSRGNLHVTTVWDPVFRLLLHSCVRAPAFAENKFVSCWELLWRSSCPEYLLGSVTILSVKKPPDSYCSVNSTLKAGRLFSKVLCSLCCLVSLSTYLRLLSLSVSVFVLLVLLAESCTAFSPSLLTLIKCTLSLCC